MPARSPAGRYTGWSTLEPPYGQLRRFSTTSGRDLLLGQVEREHGLLPVGLQAAQVAFGHVQELALGGERPAGDQGVKMRVPVQEFAAGLHRGDHARHDVVAPEQAADFGQGICPF